MSAKYDRELIFSIGIQGVNLLVPFLLIRLLYENGAENLIKYEIFLAIITFSTFIQDFGVSHIFAGRQYVRIFQQKSYWSITVFRFINVLLMLPVVIILTLFTDLFYIDILTVLMVILLGIFESSAVLSGAGKSHLVVLLLFFKALIFLISYYIFSSMWFAFFLQATSSAVLFCYFNSKFIYAKPSKRLITYFYFKNYKFAASEILTAVVSQLDAVFISIILTPDKVVQYLLARKIVRAVISTINICFRILFVRSKLSSKSIIKPTAFLLLYSVFWFAPLNYFNQEIAYLISGKPQIGFESIMLGFSFLLLLGVVKNVFCNIYLFRLDMFNTYLLGTCFTSIIFLLPFIFAYQFDFTFSIHFILGLRVSTDIIFVFVCLLIILFLKERKTRCI